MTLENQSERKMVDPSDMDDGDQNPLHESESKEQLSLKVAGSSDLEAVNPEDREDSAEDEAESEAIGLSRISEDPRLLRIREESTKTAAGRAFVDESDRLLDAAIHVPKEEGIYFVAIHGNSESVGMKMRDGTTEHMSPADLAALIRSDPESSGKTIVLGSCETGADRGEGSAFAAQLSKELGQPVLAPDQLAWYKRKADGSTEVWSSTGTQREDPWQPGRQVWVPDSEPENPNGTFRHFETELPAEPVDSGQGQEAESIDWQATRGVQMLERAEEDSVRLEQDQRRSEENSRRYAENVTRDAEEAEAIMGVGDPNTYPKFEAARKRWLDEDQVRANENAIRQTEDTERAAQDVRRQAEDAAWEQHLSDRREVHADQIADTMENATEVPLPISDGAAFGLDAGLRLGAHAIRNRAYFRARSYLIWERLRK